MSIKKLTLTCNICGHDFRPYRSRPDGLPAGTRFECEDGFIVNICTDCIMSDHYQEVIDYMKGHMNNVTDNFTLL